MKLTDAVSALLDSPPGAGSLGSAMGLLRDEFEADRVSLFAFEDGSCRLVGSAGEALLSDGTELPLETSSQMRVTASGEIFSSPAFEGDLSSSLAGDQLVREMGFRSGCAVPLMLGNRPQGTIAVTSRNTGSQWDAVLEALGELSPAITLKLAAAEPERRTRILICHEDGLLSEGIARVLEQTLAAEVRIFTALPQVQAQIEGEVSPVDVVVCDSLFGGGRTHGFLRELRAAGVTAPALVLDSHDSPLGRHVTTRGGAAGYVRLSEGTESIVAAVRKLREGKTVGLRAEPREDKRREGVSQRLTGQESRVLLLLERGLRFKQIALELGVSESTAKGYARNVFAKLGVHSRAEAVYEAGRQGVLELLRAGAETAYVDAVEQPF